MRNRGRPVWSNLLAEEEEQYATEEEQHVPSYDGQNSAGDT